MFNLKFGGAVMAPYKEFIARHSIQSYQDVDRVVTSLRARVHLLEGSLELCGQDEDLVRDLKQSQQQLQWVTRHGRKIKKALRMIVIGGATESRASSEFRQMADFRDEGHLGAFCS